MSVEQDLMSWERDNYVVGTRYYLKVVRTRQIFFHMSPLYCRHGRFDLGTFFHIYFLQIYIIYYSDL